MKELWKFIENYEGLYEVSNTGFVRQIKSGRNKPIGYVLKQRLICGYNTAMLYKEGIPKTFYVHRLVLSAFNSNPTNGKEANHKNGIRNDNRLENLEWVTASENCIHKYEVLGRKAPCGEACGKSKLTNNDVFKIRRLLELGYSQRNIGNMFNVSHSVVGAIHRKQTWKHI